MNLELQLQLEDEMFNNGRNFSRFRQNYLKKTKAESLSNAGETLSCVGFTKIIDHVDHIKKEVESGKAGQTYALLKPLLSLYSQTIAAIAIRTIVDQLTCSPSLHQISKSIGDRLWIEAMLNKLTSKELARFNQVSRQRQRHKIENLKRIEGAEIWPDKEKIACGNLLVEIVGRETGFLRIVRCDEPNKKKRIVEPTEECIKWIADVNHRQELSTPHYLPTIITPKKFDKDLVSGYYKYPYALFKTNNELIAKNSNGDEQYIQAANIQGGVAWRIKNWSLDQVEHAYNLGLTVGALLPMSGWATPPYPKHLDEDHPDIIKWKKAARSIHIRNEKTRGTRLSNAILINAARKFRDTDEIFFPISMDFRGRLYYKPPYLNPQGNDVARSLLEFSYFTYIQTEEQADWLRIHGANMYGLKSDNRTRCDWVLEHEQLIMQAGNDPWLNSQFWMRADKPWSFLSFCRSYYEWKQEGPTYKCRQVICQDCTCSGIQHYSALLRSKEMGEKVNLVNSDKPQDIYSSVMSKVNQRLRKDDNEHSRKWLALQPDRTLAKNGVMTLPYSVTYLGFYKFAYQWGIKRAKELYGNTNWLTKDGSMKTVHYMAKILHQEASAMIQPAVHAMRWFKAVGVKAGKNNIPLEWVNPAGLLVRQQYNSTRNTRVRLKYLSDIHLDIRVQEDCPTLDTSKMGKGLSANILHSADSAHMCATTIKAAMTKNVINIGGIHDCFLTTPSEMSALKDAARESFADIYKHDWLTRIKDKLKSQLDLELQEDLPAEPQLGTLDLNHTRNSTYFLT